MLSFYRYAQVHTPGAQGWVAESIPVTPANSRSVAHFPSAERHLLRRVRAPLWLPGPWLVQVLYLGGLKARVNPHPLATAVAGDHAIVPPFAIVRVDGALFVRPLRRRTAAHNHNESARRGLFIDDPFSPKSQSISSDSTKNDSVASTTRGISGTHSANVSASPSNVTCWNDTGTPILPQMDDDEGVEDDNEIGSDDDNESFNSDNDDGEDPIGTNSSSEDEDYNDASRVSDASNEGYSEDHEAGLFLKLSGRPGWLLTHSLDGSPAVLRVAGTPTEERGRFVYKVSGIPSATARHLSVATDENSGVADSAKGAIATETPLATTLAPSLAGGMTTSDSQVQDSLDVQEQQHQKECKPPQHLHLQPLRVRHGPCQEAPSMTGATVPTGSLVTARVRLTQFLNPPNTLSSSSPKVYSMAQSFIGGDFPTVGAPSSHRDVATIASGWLPLWDFDSEGRQVQCLELVEEVVESCNEGKPLSSWLTPTPSDPEDVLRRKNAPDFALACNEQTKSGGCKSEHSRSEVNQDGRTSDNARAHQPSARGSPPTDDIADKYNSWEPEDDVDLASPNFNDSRPLDSTGPGCCVH